MIRDPSDGSVRNPARPELQSCATTQLLDSNISGLRAPNAKSEYMTRLERSRQQLKNWKETGFWEERTNPEKTVREQGETGE